MVAYIDGSVLAQLGTPDMRTPIAYTLAWPERMASPSPKLALEDIATLTFEPPDPERFPALRLAREALKIGGSAPPYLNAANEIAVQYFYRRKSVFSILPGLSKRLLQKLLPAIYPLLKRFMTLIKRQGQLQKI